MLPIPLVATVLLDLLRLQLLSVSRNEGQSSQGQSTGDLWIDACLDAATLAHHREIPKTRIFDWKWCPSLSQHGEGGGAMFFNAIALTAHQLASKRAQLGKRNPIRHWWSLPMYQSDRPFVGPDGEQCRPSIVSVPIHAFGRRRIDELPPHFHPLPSSVASTISTCLETQQCRNGTYGASLEDAASTNLSHSGLKRQLQTQLQFPVPVIHTNGFDFNCLDTDYICWESFATTAEICESEDLHSAISQSMIYMRQQFLAQPHLRMALGLTKTAGHITLTRADAMGVEHATFDSQSGWGVLETVRLALGFAIADDETLGHHPGFVLEEQHCLRYVDPPTKSRFMKDRGPVFVPSTIGVMTKASWLAPENVQDADNVGDSNGQEKELGDGDTKGTAQDMKRCRVPFFFTVTENGDRYYLDYPVRTCDELSGRMTRVWCAYRQLRRLDEIPDSVDERDRATAVEQLQAGKEVFVGPYALKIQNDAVDSVASRENLVMKIKEAVEREGGSRTGASYILPPERIHTNGNVIKLVRGFETSDDIPSAVCESQQRVEVVTISLYKRRLSQYHCFGEVARAIADALRAIQWLESKGWLHRDISDGNLLLAWESLSSFSEPFSPHPKVVLCRRPPSNPEGVCGLLHDFDMSGVVNDTTGFDRENPIGTLPYIAISVLAGAARQRMTVDDLQSVFYVAYLFAFDHGPPHDEIFYPKALPPRMRGVPVYPELIREWTQRNAPFSLGAMKNMFFQYSREWYPERIPFTPDEASTFLGNWPDRTPRLEESEHCTPNRNVDIQKVIDTVDHTLSGDVFVQFILQS
ncbi:other/FunK1 protein kinase [Coprinopsis cinerea okayama7|uniref:Other/FunK1 protein kinase n=1 Tax=Coprinopsis cinerea (strain Okayama-7 / 130 / ATCC MYA-4618 / FGSC 9003) TaxID=240176 RepID=A8PCQ7_COPC7|nr:other/FunK1 protein kinase [Coprinopsis cinerea okayama7\|eukprot:XP_001840450.2 other/FunK1 protein kinase [Coprinopsis cinerea okayama7\